MLRKNCNWVAKVELTSLTCIGALLRSSVLGVSWVVLSAIAVPTVSANAPPITSPNTSVAALASETVGSSPRDKKVFIIKVASAKALSLPNSSARLNALAKQAGSKPSAVRSLAGAGTAVAVCGIPAGPSDISCTVTGNLVCDDTMGGEYDFGCSFESGLIESNCSTDVDGTSITCFAFNSTEAQVTCTSVPAASGVTGAVDSRCEFDTLVDATVAPSTLDFMAVSAGTTSQLPVTITNNGSRPITFVGASASSTEFASGSPVCGSTLASGASCAHNVRFSPSITGVKNETYTFNLASSTGLAKNLTVALTGIGIAGGAPFIVARTTAVSFVPTADGNGAAPKAIVYENIGSGRFLGSLIAPAGFVITRDECDGYLGAGQQCTVMIAPSPKAGGILRGIAQIKGTNGQVWAKIPLTGFTRVAEDCE